MATWADVWSLVDKVQKEYPSAAYLLKHPEVGPLLLKAVQGEYDGPTFQQKLYATNYWKNTADAQRKWDAFASLDPASARAQLGEVKGRLRDLSATLGRPLSAKGLHWIGVTALRNGWTEDQITDAVVGTIKWGDYGEGSGAQSGAQTKAIGGQVGATIDQIRGLEAQYMTKWTDRGRFDTALRILKGEQTLEGLQAQMAQRAKERWPHLGDVIDSGSTPAQFFEPYRALIAEQLEINPQQVDLMADPEWKQVVSYASDSGGQTGKPTIRPMTLSETERLVRSSERWKSTTGAQQEASQFAENLARAFGAVA